MTLALILIQIVVFGWQLTVDGDRQSGALPGVSQRDVRTVQLGATPASLTHLSDCGASLCPSRSPSSGESIDPAPWPLTLVTSTFMHGGVWALLFSVLFLWIFGPGVEAAMGRLGFLAFFLAAGAAAAYGQSALSPDSPVPVIGAGGAVGGVIGAYLLLCPGRRVVALVLIPLLVSVAEIPAALVALAWLGLQLLPGVGGVATPATLGEQVIYLAPFAGFAFGLAVAVILGGVLRRPEPTVAAY